MVDATGTSTKSSAYDRYVNYRRFSVAVGAFVLLLLLPIPNSMLDVAVEYGMGPKYTRNLISQELFDRSYNQVDQWQALTVRALEAFVRQGIVNKGTVIKRDKKQLKAMGVPAEDEHYDAYKTLIKSLDDTVFTEMMNSARTLRFSELTYATLSKAEQADVDMKANHIRVCLAMVAFVVICFITEAIPLPAVAFCIGLILVFSGIVSRTEVASLFWSDSVWFIMGSLMFAAAFVKTGVDKRICLALFRAVPKPSVGWVTAMLILVIAPAASFISDHALAAIFLPIGMILYSNSLSPQVPEDRTLAKMLMITIAMACNIGGFGSPSGGARNVIMMTYLEDMFGYTMGYGQWMVFGMPFVVIMIPVVWLLINWRFKPQIRNLQPALDSLKEDISRMGGWSRNQIIALVIFVVMFIGWLTEKDMLTKLIGVRLGIGVIAIAGAMAYLLTGVVNWRDYQEKVDWGVVWLYAGAIIFGFVLDQTGTAYWLARSIVEGLAEVGLDSGLALLGAGSLVTAGVTNLMADGPAAAAVGPITLNMAAVAAPGTTLIPFMALATSCASSFAYLLIIGTPPNAIVYSSGYLEAKDFLRVGVWCLIVAFLVLLALSLLLWPLIGFAGLPGV